MFYIIFEVLRFRLKIFSLFIFYDCVKIFLPFFYTVYVLMHFPCYITFLLIIFLHVRANRMRSVLKITIE